ncbi:MAG TPA: hypothetical protein VNI54_15200 [Thermoanaerobaculia bacterium]|nr:hypothetical protein [Thermoanaerobaculia bacterium]
MQEIDPVASLDATDQREHLVRCKVEGVQREAQLGMFDERKESESAVVGPLQDDDLCPAPHDRLDERRPFANDLDVVTTAEQCRAIGTPCSCQSCSRVVKEIEILRNPWCVEERVQCGATSDIALARRDPLFR